MKSAVRTLKWRVHSWGRQYGGGWRLHVTDPVMAFKLTFYADARMNCLRRAVERAREVVVLDVIRALKP